MFPGRSLRKIAIYAAFVLCGASALADDTFIVHSACELTGICSFHDCQIFLKDDPDGDMNGVGHMTLIDENGKSLKFSFSQAGVTVTRPDLRRETLVWKGPEEVCLLAVTKRSYDKTFHPPVRYEEVGKERYYAEWTVAAFIRKVERRWKKSETAKPAE